MANIIRDGSAPLWRPDLYKIFALLSLTQTQIKINTSLSLNDEQAIPTILTATITEVNGLECTLSVNSIDFPETSMPFANAQGCEYSAILDSNVSGRHQLVEYSGNARILERKDNDTGLPDELRMHFSLPGKVRPLRRHKRQDCAEWNDIIPGLTLLDNELRSRQQLLALMRHYYNKKNRIQPRLVNISAGGVCLHTEDAIARRLMHSEDRYLFFFFLKSPLEEKVPWVFLGRKAGAFRIAGSMDNGLRIQFLRELCWEKSGKELNWENISQKGSTGLGKVLATVQAFSTNSSAAPISE